MSMIDTLIDTLCLQHLVAARSPGVGIAWERERIRSFIQSIIKYWRESNNKYIEDFEINTTTKNNPLLMESNIRTMYIVSTF